MRISWVLDRFKKCMKDALDRKTVGQGCFDFVMVRTE
jgi:hypothetical protein